MQYEGISSLCFSCGHMGHRKEGCPYAIKEPMADRIMVQRVLPWMRVRLKQRGANPKRQEILTDEPKEDYGP